MSVRRTLKLVVLLVLLSSGPLPAAHRPLPPPQVIIIRGSDPAKDDRPVVPPATQTVLPTATPTVAPTSTPQPEVTQYIVQPGDTVTAIALRFGLTVQDVVGVNGLSDPDMLSVGQTLIMSSWDSTNTHEIGATAATYAMTDLKSKVAAHFYVVQAGDTLDMIGQLLDQDASKIARMNHLSNPDNIFEGEVLAVGPWYPAIPAPTRCDGKQIVVEVRSQRLNVYDQCHQVREFVVSTGAWPNLTVLGEFHTYIKFETTVMEWPGQYYLPHVPWTMYFHLGYGIHGKDWNQIYGRPSSHGCINMRVEDALWMYDWSPLGIDVLIIP